MVIKNGIITDESGALSFGDYSVTDKQKHEFTYRGDIYKLKTHNEITRLEKNSQLFLETVPGAAILGLTQRGAGLSFTADAPGDTAFTVELLPETDYCVRAGGHDIGCYKSGTTGKLMFSLDLHSGAVPVEIFTTSNN